MAIGQTTPTQQKVDAVRLLLAATRRTWYEITVIDRPQAGMALHARAVVLIPAPPIALLSAAELQAMVAHNRSRIRLDRMASRASTGRPGAAEGTGARL